MRVKHFHPLFYKKLIDTVFTAAGLSITSMSQSQLISQTYIHISSPEIS